MHRSSIGLPIMLAGLAFAPQVHAATTWTVATAGEPAALTTNDCTGTVCATLRGATNAAASGDTINFNSGVGVIALTQYTNNLSGTEFGPSAFFLTGGKSLIIDGSGRGITIARSAAAPAFRLFDVDTGSSLTLIGVTLSNGLAQGFSSEYGGGALGAGGAIFNRGVLILDRCTLDGNIAQGGHSGPGSVGYAGGGGAGQDGGANGGGPNGGSAGGGGANSNGAPGNPGGFGGGGGQGGPAASDQAGNGGNGGNGGFGGGGGAGGFGGVSISTGDLGHGGNGGNGGLGAGAGSFGPGDLTGAVAGHGGFAGGSPASATAGGAGGGLGGAIFNDGGTVVLTNVTLTGNAAQGGGNGTPAAGNGSGYGGAIFNYTGALTLSFVTVSGNGVAGGSGGTGGAADAGAIYSLGDGNCPAGGNSCAHAGATVVIDNSILFANGGADDLVYATINSGVSTLAYVNANLVDSVLPASGSSGPAPISADPQLGALSANNYPAAPPTLAVGSIASSAYNSAVTCNDAAGNPVATDARGVARPAFGQCDLGAFESESDVIFAGEFDGLPTQCSGATAVSDWMIENFRAGSAVPEPAHWTTNANSGGVNFNASQSGVSLTGGASGFPFIASAGPAIPPNGNFSVRWRGTYTAAAAHGDGTLVLSTALPANAQSFSTSFNRAEVWQDTTGGLTVRARTGSAQYNAVYTTAATTGVTHDVEYCWLGNNAIELWVDGVEYPLTLTSVTRPSWLWFGNPVAASTPWNDFELDYVRVRALLP